MTRLTSKDIESIAEALPSYDAQLMAITGCSLKALACRAAGFNEEWLSQTAPEITVAVIPISSGLGVIHGFCDAVAGIAAHLGCRSFITGKPDVAGIAEAIQDRAQVMMLADDHFFVAIHQAGHRIMDNTLATARGFAAGLALMAGGSLEGQRVLVIGCGRVGRHAVSALIEEKAYISIYDINHSSYELLFEAMDEYNRHRIRVLDDLEQALRTHRLILDASPAQGIIHPRHVRADTLVSAPGVPLGVHADALPSIGRRLLHDPLHIGVATMVAGAVKSCRGQKPDR